MKIKYGVNTFNDVLRHELGLIASPEVEELSAFLHDDLKQFAEEVVETTKGIGEFEGRVTEDRNRQVLEFINNDFLN